MTISNLALILPRVQQTDQVFRVRFRPIVEWNSSNIRKKRCILYNYPVKSAKNGKVLIPEDFHTAPNCN